MNTIQINIEAKEDQQDILISQFEDLAATGFEQTDTHLLAYFNEKKFLNNEVTELLKPYNFQINILEEKNWNEVWESNFAPVLINNFCAIRAHFHEPVKNVDHEIIITPKMSFGTGHHATTVLMIEQMKEIEFADKTIFDFGTGTGVLAILSEKLGAASVLAIDIDEWSIENAKENSEKNKCFRIILKLTSKIPDKKFDIILANINKNIILQYLPQLSKSLHKKGSLLLSGLLTGDEDEVANACLNANFHFIKRTEKNGWISLLFSYAC